MRFIVDPLPPVQVSNATPGSPSTIVGSEPIWTDRSDASYLNAVGVYQFATAISGYGTAALPAIPNLPLGQPDQAAFTIYARIRAPHGLGFPFARLSAPGAIELNTTTPTGPVPTVPTWVEFVLDTDPTRSDAMLRALADGTAVVQAGAGGTIGDVGGSIVTYDWQIYEVQVWVDAFGGLQPPLRQWPRTDGLGLSPTRRVWPPARSVQGSLRQGPGAYL